MGLLGEIFSSGDRMKRKLRGLLDDPMGTIALGSQRMSEDVQQMGLLADESGYMPGTNSVLLTPQQKERARKALADKGAEMALAAATVWHGSPHKFDKFDSSKIGTGEGAQAYGHGLYLAESDKVANEYATMFNKSAPKPASLMRLRDSAPAGSSEWKHYDALLNEGQSNLYKVDLPDEQIAKMLDWDKPLSQQAPEVQAALSGIETNFPTIPDFNLRKWMDADPLASTWHNVINRDLGVAPDAITSLLQTRGVPGIKYLDGGSRPTGGGTSNYVVFPRNDGLLKILERNGQPLK